jgi:DNA-binding IclR family transcriptional regulator
MLNTSVSGVGVLDKSVAILEALARGPASLAGLAAATGLPRPTAHRLARALGVHGLVARDAAGRFVLGPRLMTLAAAAAPASELATLARPALEGLRARTGESVQLYVPAGDRRICVASLESPHGLRTIVAVGAALPMDRGSAGKVLRDEDAARRKGFAESVEERERGVASVSAPVRVGGRVVAAVSVSGPIERTTREPGRRYAAAVMAAARELEAQLAAQWGWPPPGAAARSGEAGDGASGDAEAHDLDP